MNDNSMHSCEKLLKQKSRYNALLKWPQNIGAIIGKSVSPLQIFLFKFQRGI